jgi:hypothetical protein
MDHCVFDTAVILADPDQYLALGNPSSMRSRTMLATDTGDHPHTLDERQVGQLLVRSAQRPTRRGKRKYRDDAAPTTGSESHRQSQSEPAELA